MEKILKELNKAYIDGDLKESRAIIQKTLLQKYDVSKDGKDITQFNKKELNEFNELIDCVITTWDYMHGSYGKRKLKMINEETHIDSGWDNEMCLEGTLVAIVEDLVKTYDYTLKDLKNLVEVSYYICVEGGLYPLGGKNG